MGKEITEPEIKELDVKLSKEFGVKIEDYFLSPNNPPCFILKFPIGMITLNLKMFSSKNSHTLQEILIQSELFAKHNGFVFPFVSSPTAKIINEDPFLIEFIGMIPLVYFFVYALISKTCPKPHPNIKNNNHTRA